MKIALPFKPARPWQSHPRETAISFALIGTASLVALAGVSGATPIFGEPAQASSTTVALPALPVATDLRDVAPEEALALNARIPIAALPGAAAPPFSLGKADTTARSHALECLTSAIYYEAGRETEAGQRAVAQVILNRVRHPAYPASVCGVVYQGSTRETGCQFTYTCDGSLRHTPMTSEWNRARKVAWAALTGTVFAPVGLATHYHANYVLPYWASSVVKTHVEGVHIFYRWSGNWGRPTAFAQRYAAREANSRALRHATLSVARQPRTPSGAIIKVAALDTVEGVEVKHADAGRVIAKFTPQARAAVEAVTVVPYVERVAASQNLRQALDGAAAQGAEAAPLGRAAEASDTPTTPAS